MWAFVSSGRSPEPTVAQASRRLRGEKKYLPRISGMYADVLLHWPGIDGSLRLFLNLIDQTNENIRVHPAYPRQIFFFSTKRTRPPEQCHAVRAIGLDECDVDRAVPGVERCHHKQYESRGKEGT